MKLLTLTPVGEITLTLLDFSIRASFLKDLSEMTVYLCQALCNFYISKETF